MKKVLLLLAVLVSFGASTLYAQQKSVTGKVTDATDSQPLPGVTVFVKGNNMQSTQTNAQGDYTINVNTGDVLVFRFIGMENAERTVGSSNTINVALEVS